MPRTLALLVVLFLMSDLSAASPRPGGFLMEVLVDGRPVPVLAARGTRYIEAIKGREYTIRLRNPLGVRVAVALSVDGLNTIDAARTTAAQASKWVLGPYETVTIKGWQTSDTHARRFYFTSEERSYAQWLGKTDDIGAISAVFFRERVMPPTPVTRSPNVPGRGRDHANADEAPAPAAQPPGAAADSAARSEATPAEEYAATGIGRETDFAVQRVSLDLEPVPVASVSLRYEYRQQLVELGVLPPAPRPTPLARRERATGFDGFCPVPPR
jgi:hypothetical protein